MKKKLALALCCILLACRFLSVSMLAYGAPEGDIKRMVVWVAVPKDYAGQKDLYLCSTQTPEGSYIGSGERLYRDKEWTLMRLYIDGLQEDEYWITVSTAAQGGLPGNHVGRAFPDLERNSLLPEIDTSVTSLYMEADPQKPPLGTALTLSELTYIQAIGCPQFFCIFGTTETIGGYLEEIEGIFEQLILAYAMQVRDTYGFDTMLRRVTPWCLTYGHFHDYAGLFLPLGISLEEYADMAYNPALQRFSPESNPWNPVGTILSPWCIEEPEEPDAIRVFENDPATLLKDWGWEIYYDISDPSILVYDEFGSCITDFQFHSDGTPSNVRIPALDGSTPPSGDASFPVIGEIPGIEEIPTKSPEAVLPPEETTEPEKETIIQSFPSIAPDIENTDNRTNLDKEESAGIPAMAVIAITIVAISGIGASLFLAIRKHGKIK